VNDLTARVFIQWKVLVSVGVAFPSIIYHRPIMRFLLIVAVMLLIPPIAAK
jgi:hypothetical protein